MFSDEKEEAITLYIENKIQVAYLQLDVGRIELEAWIINKDNPKLNG